MPLNSKESNSEQELQCLVKYELLNYCQSCSPRETVVLLTTSTTQTDESFTTQIPNISRWWNNRMKILQWVTFFKIKLDSLQEGKKKKKKRGGDLGPVITVIKRCSWEIELFVLLFPHLRCSLGCWQTNFSEVVHNYVVFFHCLGTLI